MSSTPIGIDIAKANFAAAALCGEHYKTNTFNNNPAGFAQALEWLGRFEQPHVCLEATGRYGEALAPTWPSTAPRSVW